MSIIDSHVHFETATHPLGGGKGYKEQYGEEKWRILQEKNAVQQDRWRKAWRFPKPDPATDDIAATCDRWLQEMDAHDISHMVFVTSGTNEIMAQVVAHAPDRFVGYAHHDPGLPDAAEKLEYAITKQGLKGYKILGPGIDTPLDDPKLEPVWEVAEKYEIPILFHFGIMGGAGGIARHVNMSPMVLHDVAKAHPKLPLIVPHFGCGETKDTLFLAWACPNIYIDTSGSNQWTRWMPYPLTVRDLFLKFYQTIGPSRILFGTDSSWFPRGFVTQYFDQQMRDCVELGMHDADIEMIFSGNAKTLLKLR